MVDEVREEETKHEDVRKVVVYIEPGRTWTPKRDHGKYPEIVGHAAQIRYLEINGRTVNNVVGVSSKMGVGDAVEVTVTFIPDEFEVFSLPKSGGTS